MPFIQQGGCGRVNPEYSNAKCEIRVLADDSGTNFYAACINLEGTGGEGSLDNAAAVSSLEKP